MVLAGQIVTTKEKGKKMADNKMFRLTDGVTLKSIGIVVEQFLKDKKMVTQKMEAPDAIIVQGKQEEQWKKLTGMASALTVQIKMFGEDTVNVEVGNGKWTDKLGAGAVGMIAFAPLAFTAAFGAWNQKKLPEEIFARIEQHIFNRGEDLPKTNAPAAAPAIPNGVTCPSCGTVNEKGTKFCASCGAKLTVDCPKCGAKLAIGAKFCPECGEQLGGPKACPKCGSQIPEGKKFCPDCGTAI